MNSLTRIGILAVLAAMLSGPAFGRPHVRAVVATPHVSVSFNPWVVGAAPAPRAGWVWVGGHHAGGFWIPGYWAPAYTRAGMLWEPGYWSAGVYVDGYWRPAKRAGYTWVVGHYDHHHHWVKGYWHHH